MKVYVTAKFRGIENKDEIEQLCQAVKDSGMEDYCFIRDVENYQKTFEDPKDLWKRALVEIKACDVLLVDVSDNPTAGRVVEAGIAYALGLPIFVIVKNRVKHKQFFDGIATLVISYENLNEVSKKLAKFLETNSINQ